MALWAAKTPEERSEIAKKKWIAIWAAKTPKERSEIARKMWETRGIKFTDELIQQIKKRYEESNHAAKKIMEEFNISKAHLYRIVKEEK